MLYCCRTGRRKELASRYRAVRLSGRALADWLAMMNERPSMQATTRERLLARESVAA
jgi:hypothetical protein